MNFRPFHFHLFPIIVALGSIGVGCSEDTEKRFDSPDASRDASGSDRGTVSDRDLDLLDTASQHDDGRQADGDGREDQDARERTTPVYITIAGHIEPGRRYADCDRYPRFRSGLLAFLEAIQDQNTPFNLQVDYTFFVGTRECETELMREETGGQTLFDHLAAHFNVEIDPHQEGGQDAPDAENPDTYADIHAVGSEVSSTITDTVGGFVWEDSDQMASFRNGVAAAIIDGAPTWSPNLLTMAVAFAHRGGNFDQDDKSSGVWRPQGAGSAFWTDEPTSALAYIGPGHHHSSWGPRQCEFDSATAYAEVLLRYIDEGRLPKDKIYTTTLAIPQGVIFDPDRHSEVVAMIEEADALVAQEKVIFASYTEVAAIWRDSYQSEPNIVRFSEIDPADYSCERR